MIEDGLITRENDPIDGRRSFIALTEEGREKIEQLLFVECQKLCTAIAGKQSA